MSQFSNRCKELIKENGTNVCQLAARSSLERTALQRMVTGKRLPNIEFVKEFCHSLRISSLEEEEVLELYKIESMGETAYRNEKTILHLLNQLKNLEETKEQSPLVSTDYYHISLHSNTSSNKKDTELMAKAVMVKEFTAEGNRFIYANIPGIHSDFLHTLEIFARQFSRKLPVKHLTHFQINADLSNMNLEIFDTILPLYLSNILEYQTYYYYSRLTNTDQSHLIYPYYIITSQYVLLFAENFESSILLSEEEIIRQYIKQFHSICSMAKPLFQRTTSLKEAAYLYKNMLSSSVSTIYYLHYQPCYMNLFPTEHFQTIASTLFSSQSESAKYFLDGYALRASLRNIAYYSESGIEEFCKTGTYYGQIGAIFPPLLPAERKTALEYYLAQTTSTDSQMLNHSAFPFPKHLYFELHDCKRLQIIRILAPGQFDFITIEESSICEAFQQFFTALPESKYLYSKLEERKCIRTNMNLYLKSL